MIAAILALVCLTVLLPGQSAAQTPEDTRTILFSCTFEADGQHGELSIADDQVTYIAGADLSTPDISVTNSFSQTGFLPGPKGPIASNRITLVDGDTSYEISQQINLISAVLLYYGTVTTTDGTGQAKGKTCNLVHSGPNLTQLASQVTQTPTQILDLCLTERRNPHACFGVVTTVLVHRHECEGSQVTSPCWAIEQRIWDDKLAQINLDAIAELDNAQAADALRASHADWLAKRETGCAEGGNDYASGHPYCYVTSSVGHMAGMLGFERLLPFNQPD